MFKQKYTILNFRHVVNVVVFIFGDSQASEFYVPSFRNTLCLFRLHRSPKRRHIKFRRRGITQKKEYNKKYDGSFTEYSSLCTRETTCWGTRPYIEWCSRNDLLLGYKTIHRMVFEK